MKLRTRRYKPGNSEIPQKQDVKLQKTEPFIFSLFRI